MTPETPAPPSELGMKLIARYGRIEIWEVVERYGSDFYVFGVASSGAIVCPSLAMAYEVAASG